MEDIEISKQEVQKLDSHISDLKLQYEQLQHEITNIKISQTMRRSQIARLSGLSQPVEFDQTYFFANRHPNADEEAARNSNGQQVMPQRAIATQMMRTGDTVILESRLDNVTKLIQGQLTLFQTKLSAINMSEMTAEATVAAAAASAAFETKRSKLRAESIEVLKELEKKEDQLFATILELLNLRLRMMVAQREEVEEREVLKNETEEYRRKEAELMCELNEQLDENKRQFDKDLAYQLNKYKRQLEKSTKKLNVLETFDQRKVTEQKDMKLVEKLEQSKVRYERLCRRHELELEGYTSEANALKNKLKYAQRAMKMMMRC